MKRWMRWLPVLVGLGLAACGGTEEPTDSNDTITREQARAMDGKSDHGIDLCEYFDWYDDGICDEFCPDPDPDCALTCAADADCAAGEVCTAGVCEPDTTAPDPDPTDDCGGIAGLTCDDDEWCDYPDDSYCGAADQLGTCVPRPDDCAQIYDPVCGCDGQTYSNACTANAAGVDAAASGPCDGPDACQADADCADDEICENGTCEPAPSGGDCGGFAGFTCQDDEWCDYPDGTFCGAADHLGTCLPRPDACAQVYDPVCGCDGQTYSNECMANAAGVDAAGDGPCN